MKALPSGATRSPGVVEAEKEFVAEIIDSFYMGLKRFVALVLKGSTTPFSALRWSSFKVLTAFETLEGMTKLPHWSFWWRGLKGM